MPKIDVEEQLGCDFCSRCPHARRAVLWFGTMRTGEFAPEFERLAAEGFDGVGPMPA